MADELISRKAVKEALLGWETEPTDDEMEWAIDNIPSVNAVVLPCKVGDTVYEVHNNTSACGDCNFYNCGFGDVWCEKIEDVGLREYPDIAEKPLCEKQFMEVREHTPDLNWIFHHREDFGKTVFLTREEAEKALEGREDNAR